jgi:hypothetical protein
MTTTTESKAFQDVLAERQRQDSKCDWFTGFIVGSLV